MINTVVSKWVVGQPTGKVTGRHAYHLCTCACGFKQPVRIDRLSVKKCPNCSGGQFRENAVGSFWQKVIKTDGCWIWSGHKDKDGYGRVRNGKKRQTAHSFSYNLHLGEIKKGLYVLHKCDNPSCVNPDHLFLGTAKDNYHDSVIKNRNSHGERHGLSKITIEQAAEIKKLLSVGNLTVREIASKCSVTKNIVYGIKQNKTWRSA